jgi:hypothetical protein
MKDKEIFTTVKPEVIFGQLFQSRDTMHIVHLQTLNYSEHKALDSYYSGLLGLTDDLIEAYFGTLGGKRINFKIPASEYVNANQHLTQMFDYLKKHRGVFGSDNTHIQNILDEILALISNTIYQLTLT